jgi:hypothetical protein
VKVQFNELSNKVRPKDHIDILRPLLPDKYSPLQPNGNGLQSVYLTEVPATLAEVLIGLIGQEVTPIAMSAVKVKPVSTDDLDSWERKIEQGVVNDPSIPETDRLAIVRARKGQGLFKDRILLFGPLQSPSFRPDPQYLNALARRAGQGWPPRCPCHARRISRPLLDRSEHDGRLRRVGNALAARRALSSRNRAHAAIRRATRPISNTSRLP